jgi:hypothetical protein
MRVKRGTDGCTHLKASKLAAAVVDIALEEHHYSRAEPPYIVSCVERNGFIMCVSPIPIACEGLRRYAGAVLLTEVLCFIGFRVSADCCPEICQPDLTVVQQNDIPRRCTRYISRVRATFSSRALTNALYPVLPGLQGLR